MNNHFYKPIIIYIFVPELLTRIILFIYLLLLFVVGTFEEKYWIVPWWKIEL
jgi:hypothetical protein